jgi:hypothetical protein
VKLTSEKTVYELVCEQIEALRAKDLEPWFINFDLTTWDKACVELPKVEALINSAPSIVTYRGLPVKVWAAGMTFRPGVHVEARPR